MKRAALLAPLLLAAAAPPLPPEKPASVDAPATSQPDRDADPLPPYQADVEQLAGLMGTLSFLRDLCGAGDGAQWRARMEDLLASEGATPVRRNRLAGAFNEGLRSYAETYRQCTPAAKVATDRTLDTTARLTRELANRYGG